MTCKDCGHFRVCAKKGRRYATHTYGKGNYSTTYISGVESACADFQDAEKIAVFPFVAMVEQTLVNGKFADSQKEQAFNGRYAVVYIDKKKWGSPLIDVCGKFPYNKTEAENRLKELRGKTDE